MIERVNVTLPIPLLYTTCRTPECGDPKNQDLYEHDVTHKEESLFNKTHDILLENRTCKMIISSRKVQRRQNTACRDENEPKGICFLSDQRER
ncbi:hypothetical protein COOONC_24908 [Cooperia oncophora]